MWNPRPILQPWTPDQRRVAEQLPARRRLAVPAANGVGKTYLAADLAASFIADMPAAAVILTAPTNRQVCELLWPHIADRLIEMGLVEQDWTIPIMPKWSGGDGDHLIGFATNTPQRMQGFHAENLLVLIDEASGLPMSLVEALEGIAVGENNHIVAIGNPNVAEGAFYEMTRRPSWHTETISALTHPNILAHREEIPGATTWTTLIDRVRDWCKETDCETDGSDDTFTIEVSEVELQTGWDETRVRRTFSPNDAFRIRYLGRFPSAVQWSLINRGYVNAAMDAIIPGNRPRIAAVDVARTGGDRTIYALRQGDTVTKLITIAPQELMKQADDIKAILHADDPEKVVIDAAGLGIGLIDRLRGITDVEVVSFHGSGEPVAPSQQKKYLNRRAAAYANLQIAFEGKRIAIPKDPDLADELAAVRYRHTFDGRMQIEDKERIKMHLGRSPDAADAISLLWEHGTDFTWIQPTAVAARPEQITW